MVREKNTVLPRCASELCINMWFYIPRPKWPSYGWFLKPLGAKLLQVIIASLHHWCKLSLGLGVGSTLSIQTFQESKAKSTVSEPHLKNALQLSLLRPLKSNPFSLSPLLLFKKPLG